MPFGRGFGFRGWSPPWPYVGLGRGGLPRCWAYAAFWGAPYPYGVPYGYGTEAYPYGWGTGYPAFNAFTPSGYSPWYPYDYSSWEGPYGSPMTAKGEKEWLKSQADSIKQQIDQINSRIAELGKE